MIKEQYCFSEGVGMVLWGYLKLLKVNIVTKGAYHILVYSDVF